MQIHNNPQIQQTTPNFKAIKTVKYKGLYKKFPEFREGVMDAFQKNSTAMDFCNKYDIEIIFNAVDDASVSGIMNYLRIKFINPKKRKSFGLIKKATDTIKLQSYASSLFYNDTKEGLSKSIEILKDHILGRTHQQSLSQLIESKKEALKIQS